MGILVDSGCFIALERAARTAGELPPEMADEEIFISVISASELLHGIHRADTASRRAKRTSFVEEILARVPVLEFDLESARVHARLWATLARTGNMIGAHDLLIASQAISATLPLLTRNVREFARVPELEVRLWPD